MRSLLKSSLSNSRWKDKELWCSSWRLCWWGCRGWDWWDCWGRPGSPSSSAAWRDFPVTFPASPTWRQSRRATNRPGTLENRRLHSRSEMKFEVAFKPSWPMWAGVDLRLHPGLWVDHIVGKMREGREDLIFCCYLELWWSWQEWCASLSSLSEWA